MNGTCASKTIASQLFATGKKDFAAVLSLISTALPSMCNLLMMKFTWPASFHFVSKSSPEGTGFDSAIVAAYAREISKQLEENGVRSGDRVALWLSSGVEQVAAILGCWMVGASFCFLPSYTSRTGSERSKKRTEDIISVLEPKLAIHSLTNRLPDNVANKVSAICAPTLPQLGSCSKIVDTRFELGNPDELAFIQFTSGSTGETAKGAMVSFRQLQANLDALSERSGFSHHDKMVSWAPLFHDMGLMAVLLSLRKGASLVLLETERFIRRPASWLEAISRFQGTVTTAPPTALKLLSRRRVSDIDLGSLRYAWIGGEAVFPVVLKDFEECYAEANLGRGVMQPTYGMAETVVGISCGEPNTPWSDKNGFVSCGMPLHDMQTKIIDENDNQLSENLEGRIVVRGPSVFSGYLGHSKTERNDWLETGDRGFLSNGTLYVTGRVKDVLKRGAESFPASLVEQISEETLGLHTGRAAAFINPRPELGKEEIVVLVETREWTNEKERLVVSSIFDELGLQIDQIRAIKSGRLPRTSSGKLMRQIAAQLYREGRI